MRDRQAREGVGEGRMDHYEGVELEGSRGSCEGLQGIGI